MLMADVKVGDRIVMYGATGAVTVTEITDRGFRYEVETPYCVHWSMGTHEGGEHFGADGEVCDADYYRRANMALKAAAQGGPR